MVVTLDVRQLVCEDTLQLLGLNAIDQTEREEDDLFDNTDYHGAVDACRVMVLNYLHGFQRCSVDYRAALAERGMHIAHTAGPVLPKQL